jgi:hypothetical protein
MHQSVPAIGLTSLDQRQPGSNQARPIMVSAIVDAVRERACLVRLIEASHLHGPHGTPSRRNQ